MNVAEIKIRYKFKRTNPSNMKMEICRSYFKKNGKLDRNIVVDEQGFLCDGYIGYLVLLENNVKDVEVTCKKQSENTVYVFGRHNFDGKEYVWKLSKNVNIEDISIGSKILVQTRFGAKNAIVTKIESLSCSPIDMPVKKVLRCINN